MDHMAQKQKAARRNTKPGSPGPLLDPRKEREGEKIGGGWFVFRRTSGTGRIRVPEWPFEHPTITHAKAERNRLETMFPEEKFVVGFVAEE